MTQEVVTTQPQSTILLATFLVRGALCALDASGIQEVMRLSRLTEVRHAPPEVLGILNLRGRIVTILDLGLRLGFEKVEPSADSRVFIVESRNEFIGLVVDAVGEVVEVDRGSLEPTPANVRSTTSRLYDGVFRTHGRVTALIDIEQLLADGIQ
jgi:purine-binding chemotaxis protein CheW